MWRSKHVVAAICALGAALGLGGCKCSSDKGPDYCKASAPPAGWMRHEVRVFQQANVKLVKPGAEPRRELRYAFARGESGFGQGFDGQRASLGTNYTLRTRCVDGTHARLESLAVGPLYPDAELTLIEVDERGVIARAFADRRAGEAAAQPFESPIVVFPKEPVGGGAEWTVDQPLGEGNVVQMKFTLTRLEDDLLELRRERPGARPETARNLLVSTKLAAPLRNVQATFPPSLAAAKQDLAAMHRCAKDCAEKGLCSARGESCEAESEGDCWYSDICRTELKCSKAVDHCDTEQAAVEYRKTHTKRDTVDPKSLKLMEQYLEEAKKREKEEGQAAGGSR